MELDLQPATTHSAAETEALGQRLGAALHPGDVLALHGDLGAGKTHLTRGIARALGCDPDAVSSPTFTLVHEYAGGVPLIHIDAYRFEHPEELLRLGFDEYLSGEAVVVVEWPERVAALLPPETRHLCLRHGGGDVRHVRWCAGAVTEPS